MAIHTLRHSFACLLLPSIANVYDVQKVLRSDLLGRVGELPPEERALLDGGLRLVFDPS